METLQTIACEKLVSSPQGTLVAELHPPYLSIRDALTLRTVRCITIPADISTRTAKIHWAPIDAKSQYATRFLLSDEQKIRIWDLRDPKWTVFIANGSAGMGKIANAEFGLMGEVLVWNDFGSKVTVWDIEKGRGIEIRDPKYADGRGSGYRPRRDGEPGIFALLTRPGPHDVLSLHRPGSYEVIRSLELPTTDAQGLKWSPDGRWIAIWDTPREGHKVFILTCDGHTYRQWTGQNLEKVAKGLGVRCVEWSPSGDFLAIGDFDGRITLLNTRTFSPVSTLEHMASVKVSTDPALQIYTESSTASPSFTVQTLGCPYDIPQVSVDTPKSKATKPGISHLKISPTGRLLVTVSSNSPTALFVWSMPESLAQHSAAFMPQRAKPSLYAIMVYVAPIVSVSWASRRCDGAQDDTLLIHTSLNGQSNVYVWTGSRQPDISTGDQMKGIDSECPRKICSLPFADSQNDTKSSRNHKTSASVSWLCYPHHPHLGITVCDGGKGTILWPWGRPERPLSPFAGTQGEEPARQDRIEAEDPASPRQPEDDSLFDILMGVPAEGYVETTETIYRQEPSEDTFAFRTTLKT